MELKFILSFAFLMALQPLRAVDSQALMQAPILHKLHGQNLWLSAQRSLFWEEEKALVVSDLHFGKTGHFRKAGIAVPQHVYKEDLQRLVSLLHHFGPVQLIVVGDFFHSRANTELDWFKRWRDGFSSLAIRLVKGNHDILQDAWYSQAGIEVIQPTLQMVPFLFSHDKCEAPPAVFPFFGHIHPGVLIHGLAKQSLRFPCFYFTKNYCVLPAFSKFTGAVAMDQQVAKNIFAIVENELIPL